MRVSAVFVLETISIKCFPPPRKTAVIAGYGWRSVYEILPVGQRENGRLGDRENVWCYRITFAAGVGGNGFRTFRPSPVLSPAGDVCLSSFIFRPPFSTVVRHYLPSPHFFTSVDHILMTPGGNSFGLDELKPVRTKC